MKIIFFILTKLPFKINLLLGKFIGYLLYIKSKDKNVISENISLCFPNLNQKQKKALIKHSTINLGISITQSFYFWGNSFENNKKIINNINGLELIKDEATILLTPHFGGFEITGRVLSLYKKMTFLYKPAKNKTLDNLIFKSRSQGNLSVVPTNNKGIFAITRSLKQNEIVGILPDQSPGKNSGIIVDFFNVGSKTTTLLAKLNQKFHPNVILTYAVRNANGYDLVLEKVDIDAENTTKSVLKMNKIIEKLVLKYPDQYLWNYKKFKATHSYKS